MGKYRNAVEKMLKTLGIVVEKYVGNPIDRDLYQKWNEAKKAKDFEKADVYRQQLIERGVL